MSSGPEHYREAEIAQQAAAAMQADRKPGPTYTPTEALLDALVHATLALAAAFTEVGQSDNWQAAFEAGTGS
jgi:hypothetical protein